jgi:hypothetical protein
MKNLVFTVKRNLKKPPKIYVLSADKKTTYGSFTADNIAQFEHWEQLNPEETIELKQYMNNMGAIERHFSSKALNEQQDFRVRLPESFIEAIHEISLLCLEANQDIDIYGAMISASIQYLKIITAQLPDEQKNQALTVLDRIGLAEYKKIDLSLKIRAVFAELLSIHNKSEKLHQKAIELYRKDKSISPRTIEEIAKGESTPRWIVACAIDVLLEEKPALVRKILTDEDLFFLWAKPLIDDGHLPEQLTSKTGHLVGYGQLNKKIISTHRAGFGE